MIVERRQLFQQQLAGMYAAVAAEMGLGDLDVAALAQECDGYINGLAGLAFATDQLTLPPEYLERSLLAMIEARRASQSG